MRILCCGDQHITKKRPKNRTDDYAKTVISKFKQELDIAVEEGCRVAVFPGDFFDTFKEDHFVVQDVMDVIKQYPKIVIVGVAGQHDQQFHNPELKGTALQTLISAGYFKLLSDVPTEIDYVHFYGSSWKFEVPPIVDPERVNVLAIHKMIVEEKLWAAQEGHTWANHFLMKNNFDLIVSGDNHQQFFSQKGNRHLVNLGSMMRSTIAQVNHHPAVAIYDTDTKTVDIIDMDVKPIDEVMQVAKAEADKEKNEKLEAFVSSLKEAELKEGQAMKLDFVGALEEYINENNIESGVAKAIFDSLEE